MATRLKAICVLLLLLPSLAKAAGFEASGPVSPLTRAEDVLLAPINAPCVLEGRIIERIPRRHDRYLFEDKSGRVVTRIGRRIFGDFTVTPSIWS